MEEFKQGKIDFDAFNQDPTILLDEENQELGVEAAVENKDEVEEDFEATEEENQLHSEP
jgi:hypothetical protein